MKMTEWVKSLEGRLFYFRNEGAWNDIFVNDILGNYIIEMGEAYKGVWSSICSINMESRIKEESKFNRIAHSFFVCDDVEQNEEFVLCSKEYIPEIEEEEFFSEFSVHRICECPECEYKDKE